MVNREDIGSWLEGPPRESRGAYPGERLGLPENGPGSIAPMWRRVVALFIDGIMSQLIAMGLLGYVQGEGGLGVFKPLLVVFVINVLMVGTAGWTVGHRVMGLRVDLCPRGYAGFLRGLVRSALLCLGIPPLIMDSDQRGLHDKIAGTVVVRA